MRPPTPPSHTQRPSISHVSSDLLIESGTFAGVSHWLSANPCKRVSRKRAQRAGVPPRGWGPPILPCPNHGNLLRAFRAYDSAFYPIIGLGKQGVVHPREGVLHPEAGVKHLFQLRQWGEPVTINTIPILRSNQGRPIQKAAEPLQSYVRFI